MAQNSGTPQNAQAATDQSAEGRRIPETRSGGTPARLADETTQGKTTISASVVQKIAGISAREISGVYAMGGGVSRAFGAIRERIPGGSGTSSTSGVQVEVGEKQAAVDLDLIVEYGASIVDLARAVRRNVITAVERMTGLEVIEVNIAVNDIHLPSEDGEESGEQATARVE
ncbi:Asp23/Gls24 family envelope stress response protein [Saccharopolyspora phatthalungensis]|uniref:Putative alkaline shock family protein YloU n=1 Tax=Saccharopolyspora phatthalungensis TaxID=664693 RepID=A0A840Q7D2_9PSEU|nr:Asp23/Gls24 family envelope stress response protein [Saccharopolyspora phatthalungensis]MBB5156356.1 putative alkaline shock family protein YloU [Saccharopolyspora phatthalungensis]